jgi:hypothetical protein
MRTDLSSPDPVAQGEARAARRPLAHTVRLSAALLNAITVLALSWVLAGCGARSESAADGGGQAATFVKAYTIGGRAVDPIAVSTADDGSHYVLVQQPQSPLDGASALVLARLNADGDPLWSRRPEGAVVGTLEELAIDKPGQRLTAPAANGQAWVIGSGQAATFNGGVPDVRRLHRLSADGAIVQTLPLPDAVGLQAMAPAAGGFVAAGTTALGRARHLWVLHVNDRGEVVSSRSAGPTDSDLEVVVHAVAFHPAGGYVVNGHHMRLGALRPERGPDAALPSEYAGRFSAGFRIDGTLLYYTVEGSDLAGPEARRVDPGVWVNRGSAGAQPDWIVATRALWTFQEDPDEVSPVGPGLLRLDSATGQRLQSVEPPSSAGAVCTYLDLRVVSGGANGVDLIEALGHVRSPARACLDRWRRDPASGDLSWVGRTWLGVPDPGAAQAHQARWSPDGQAWVAVQRADTGLAVLHGFDPADPVTPRTRVPLPWGPVETEGGYAANLTVLSDGDLLVSAGLVEQLRNGPSRPLARLRSDGSVRWTLARQETLAFERAGSLVQALPGGGVVVLSGSTWLRYGADGQLLHARTVGPDFDPGAVRGLVLLDRDGDGRDDDALLLATLAGAGTPEFRSVLRLRVLDATGVPLGQDQLLPLGPDAAEAWVNERPRRIDLRRAGNRRMVAVTREVAAPPLPEITRLSVPEHTVLWTDAAGSAQERVTLNLGGAASFCDTPMRLSSLATVPHEDGRLTLVVTGLPHPTDNGSIFSCYGKVSKDFRVLELQADGTLVSEWTYLPYDAPGGTNTSMPIFEVGADRLPDGGLLLRMRWPGTASEAWRTDVAGLFVDGEYGDQGLVALAPDGSVRWTRSFGAARGESFLPTDGWRGAQRDNGALALGRSNSFAVPGAMLAVRTDADGRVGEQCQAVRDATSAYAFRFGPPYRGASLLAAARREPAVATRAAAVAGAQIAGFSDSAVNWEVARACSGTARSPDLMVEVSGPGQVDSQPGGIACRAGLGSDCAQAFTTGSSVVLTATPAPGAGFAGWEGDCAGAGSGPAAALQMDQPRRCVARFQEAAPPPPPAGSCRADAPLAGAWQDTLGAAVPVPGLGYGVAATLRGGLPLVAVSTTPEGGTATHRPWVAQWTGSTWSRLGSDADPALPGFAGPPQIRADANAVWLAWSYTDFSTTDGDPPNRIEVRVHDGSGWRALPRPVAQPSGTLVRWWLLLPADGAPVVAWQDPTRQRVELLRWSGSAWDPLEPLEAPVAAGLWALATDAAGARLGAAWAGTPGAAATELRSWQRPPGGPGTPWVERSTGTLPGPGSGAYMAQLEMVLDGERMDVVLQRADTSGRAPDGGPFVVGRQATGSGAWAALGDAGTLLRTPDLGVRPVGLQLLAGCSGAPWLAWRDDLNYPEARLWAAQSWGSTAATSWQALGSEVVPQAAIGSVMRVLAAGDGSAWAVVVRATPSAAGSSVLRPELRLRRFVPAGS